MLAYAILSDYPKNLTRLIALDQISFSESEEKVKMLAKREYIHGLSIITAKGNDVNHLDVSI
jgi:hypothetical protein